MGAATAYINSKLLPGFIQRFLMKNFAASHTNNMELFGKKK
jgi:hypothetical protein